MSGGLLSNLSNIYDGVLRKYKSLISAFEYFLKKSSSQMLDRVLNTPRYQSKRNLPSLSVSRFSP